MVKNNLPQSGTERSVGTSGRERLLKTAYAMFTIRGFANVGINEATEGAGVGRMTLYNNFASKDALVLAVYEDLMAATLADIDQNRGKNEEERILALFTQFEHKAKNGGDRGCPFIHAGLQMPEPQGQVFALVSRYKQELRQRIIEMLEPKRRNRSDLADQLLLFLDGAAIERHLQGVPHPGESAKKAVITLLRAG